MHKLIVATRRHSSATLKAKKDLAQAEVLFQILLEDRPAELADSLETALAKGPAWRDAIDASVRQSDPISEVFAALMT